MAFKVVLCSHFDKPRGCIRGATCTFAHGQSDLRSSSGSPNSLNVQIRRDKSPEEYFIEALESELYQNKLGFIDCAQGLILFYSNFGKRYGPDMLERVKRSKLQEGNLKSFIERYSLNRIIHTSRELAPGKAFISLPGISLPADPALPPSVQTRIFEAHNQQFGPLHPTHRDRPPTPQRQDQLSRDAAYCGGDSSGGGGNFSRGDNLPNNSLLRSNSFQDPVHPYPVHSSTPPRSRSYGGGDEGGHAGGGGGNYSWRHESQSPAAASPGADGGGWGVTSHPNLTRSIVFPIISFSEQTLSPVEASSPSNNPVVKSSSYILVRKRGIKEAPVGNLFLEEGIQLDVLSKQSPSALLEVDYDGIIEEFEASVLYQVKMDKNGKYLSKQEFFDIYNNNDEWDNAPNGRRDDVSLRMNDSSEDTPFPFSAPAGFRSLKMSAYSDSDSVGARLDTSDISSEFIKDAHQKLSERISEIIKGQQHTLIEGTQLLCSQQRPQGKTDFVYFEILGAATKEGSSSDTMFIGKWKPQSALSPRPPFVSEGDYVMVKRTRHQDDRDAQDLIKRIRNYHQLQVAAGGDRYFVGLIDAYSCRSASSREVYVFEIMELCLASLSQRLDEYGYYEQTEREQYFVAWSIISSVNFMHNTPSGSDIFDTLHRDIRPSNILFSRYGHVLLGDFGDSCIADSSEKKKGNSTRDYSLKCLISTTEQNELTLMPRKDGLSNSQTDAWLVGQTLFYVFSRGCFPFVDPKISADPKSPFPLKVQSHDRSVSLHSDPHWEVVDPRTPPPMLALIQELLLHEALHRPSMKHAKLHPAFWSLSHYISKSSHIRSALEDFKIYKQSQERPIIDDAKKTMIAEEKLLNQAESDERQILMSPEGAWSKYSRESKIEADGKLKATYKEKKENTRMQLKALEKTKLEEARRAIPIHPYKDIFRRLTLDSSVDGISCAPILKPVVSWDPASRSTVKSIWEGRVSTNEMCNRWRSLIRATPDVGPELLEQFSGGGDIESDAEGCLLWCRHITQHFNDKCSAHLRPDMYKAVTVHPEMEKMTWSDANEYIIRHPAVGWIWPSFWRELLALKTSHSPLFKKYYLHTYMLVGFELAAESTPTDAKSASVADGAGS